jgi:hypothetical protein
MANDLVSGKKIAESVPPPVADRTLPKRTSGRFLSQGKQHVFRRTEQDLSRHYRVLPEASRRARVENRITDEIDGGQKTATPGLEKRIMIAE